MKKYIHEIRDCYAECRLEGDLTSEQKQRLLQIADRCPVHRTLENNPVIVTREE